MPGRGVLAAECLSIEGLKELIKMVLRESNEPLTSMEVFEKLGAICGHSVNKFLARMALARLIREGVVEKLRGDEIRGIPRHVYRLRETGKSG